MILTIDVGNTAVGVAIFDDDKIVFWNKLLMPVEVERLVPVYEIIYIRRKYGC